MDATLATASGIQGASTKAKAKNVGPKTILACLPVDMSPKHTEIQKTAQD